MRQHLGTDPDTTSVYTPTILTAAFPAPLAHQVPAPVHMTVQNVVLADGSTVSAYVPATPAAPAHLAAHRPAYRPVEDPAVMRSLAGGALLAGGGVGAWGLGSLVESVGALLVDLGQVAASAGGTVLGLALLAALVKRLASAASTGPGALAAGTAGAAPGAVTTTVTVAPQQVIQARRVRIKNLNATQNFDL
ncbi:hypothetical protein [Kitasatospora cineracea]|uniref:Uncharacterized protein n=1 Tax=Kitasatospora cineracea TaxID=88074 RepID=A0A3N4R210_9ACTN|nr:hypothetical protein [Kitasatospora cineracea]RPE26616.1 hypothetical protein EDD38_7677 [Kitasatospora cineracea]